MEDFILSNTHDMKSDEMEEPVVVNNLIAEIENLEEECCDSCAI